MREQAEKVRGELMILDALFNECRKVLQFKAWSEKFNASCIEERLAELSEYIKKGDMLTKVLKNMLASMKTGERE